MKSLQKLKPKSNCIQPQFPKFVNNNYFLPFQINNCYNNFLSFYVSIKIPFFSLPPLLLNINSPFLHFDEFLFPCLFNKDFLTIYGDKLCQKIRETSTRSDMETSLIYVQTCLLEFKSIVENFNKLSAPEQSNHPDFQKIYQYLILKLQEYIYLIGLYGRTEYRCTAKFHNKEESHLHIELEHRIGSLCNISDLYWELADEKLVQIVNKMMTRTKTEQPISKLKKFDYLYLISRQINLHEKYRLICIMEYEINNVKCCEIIIKNLSKLYSILEKYINFYKLPIYINGNSHQSPKSVSIEENKNQLDSEFKAAYANVFSDTSYFDKGLDDISNHDFAYFDFESEKPNN